MADDPASLYEQALREAVAEQADPPSLDFILLGIGEDGHTASLFPGSAAIDIADRWVAVNDDETVTPPPRVTMTYPLINAGRYVAVLVTGSKKTDALHRIEAATKQGATDPHELPITGVKPNAEPLHWHLDAAATGVMRE
jgi:6-phosphogluconolactonase/glucosamine-6-phosphate isomerase/deaminase